MELGERLTGRERECLIWIAQGKRDTEISTLLGIAESTITVHVRNAARKLRATNRTHAVAIALQNKLIEL